MTRHILDHPREGEGRIVNFTRIERENGPHPATQDLQRRASEAGTPDDLRTTAFLRVERGRTT